MKLDDFEAALESFSKAFELAHAQEDRAAEAAIRKAIQDVKASIVLKQSKYFIFSGLSCASITFPYPFFCYIFNIFSVTAVEHGPGKTFDLLVLRMVG